MHRIAPAAGLLALMSASAASAGALDRTGQPIGVIFEDGNYAEVSFGWTAPDVQGVFASPLGGPAAQSGDVGVDFGLAALSIKYDVNDQLSFGLILDHPFGADVDYGDSDAFYPIAGSNAEFESTALTALARYKVNENFSVHAGARAVQVDARLLSNVIQIDPVTGGATLYSYDGEFDKDTGFGYVVGGAYERPDIALRVALTYSSAIDMSHETTFTGTAIGQGPTEYTLPQSVNLDFQTGIAAGTLLFGSVRWADWSETQIDAFGYALNPVVSYEDDVVTYTLGVGRQITEQLAGSAAIIYEPSTASDFDPTVPGSGVSNLSPTDGLLAVQLGASYAVTEQVEVALGVRYSMLGDATTRGIGARFEDNDALSVGARIGFKF